MKFSNLILILFISILVGAFAYPCATVGDAKPQSEKAWKKYWKSHAKITKSSDRKIASLTDKLPDITSPHPWGGSVGWRPEAILANASSRALNEGWSRSGVTDVLVSVPLKMIYSSVRPYGDGQSNATFAFGQWRSKQPQLVSSLIQYYTRAQTLRFRLEHSLPIPSDKVVFTYWQNGVRKAVALQGARESGSGDLIVEWTPTATLMPSFGDLFQNRVAFLQPEGWNISFPVDFRDVVRSNVSLLEELPPSWQTLGRGTMLDPERVSVQGMNTSAFPFLNMENANFGSDINASRYFPVPGSGIHNEFPVNGGVVMTSVGRGNTLVMQNAPSHFKSAYICFDARNISEEQKYGVPSGGGWHEIGDFAETVLNSLENGPAVFGYANSAPDVNPPSGKIAYALTDIAVIRKIKPGFAIITAAGATTLKECPNPNQPDPSQCRGPARATLGDAGRNYHWFIFDQPHEVCAMEWVHPRWPQPNNHLGF